MVTAKIKYVLLVLKQGAFFLISLFVPTYNFNSSNSFYLKLFNKLLCGRHIPVQSSFNIDLAWMQESPNSNDFSKTIKVCDNRHISYREYLYRTHHSILSEIFKSATYLRFVKIHRFVYATRQI